MRGQVYTNDTTSATTIHATCATAWTTGKAEALVASDRTFAVATLPDAGVHRARFCDVGPRTGLVTEVNGVAAGIEGPTALASTSQPTPSPTAPKTQVA